MTGQLGAVEAVQADYDAALGLMREGSQREAQTALKSLIARCDAMPDAIHTTLAANAMCSLACSERDNGQVEEALQTFKFTSMTFGYGGTDESRYVAALADLLASKLFFERDRPKVAHALLDHMTLRIMMEESAKFRALFDEAMAQKAALERIHGFEPGAGIGMDRIDIGENDEPGDLPDLDPADPPGPPSTSPTMVEPPKPVAIRRDTQQAAYRYESIKSKFETDPHSWQLGPQELTVTHKGQVRTMAYTDIARLTLRFAPSRFNKRRYTMRVQARDGASTDVDNQSFVGIGKFEDRSVEYAQLVLGLSQKLDAAGSDCQVVGGVSWPYYLLSAGLGGVALLIVLFTFLVGGPILILIKVAVIAAYLPGMVHWLKCNRPARGTLTALPAGTVPPLVA